MSVVVLDPFAQLSFPSISMPSDSKCLIYSHHALVLPWGSTSFASFRASELARSVFAGVTARIKQLSLLMNCMIMSLICCSMSAGWSPTGTLVIPGRSIRVRFRTSYKKRDKHVIFFLLAVVKVEFIYFFYPRVDEVVLWVLLIF